jgi:hypothetical protein
MYYDASGRPSYKCKNTEGDPNADCHKMRYLASELEGAVLAVIRKQAEVMLGTSDLGGLVLTGGGSIEAGIEERLAETSKRLQKHYESYILREIDRDEFVRLKKPCSEEIERLGKQAAALKSESRSMATLQCNRGIAERAVSDTISHKELISALIEKVLVFPGNRIEIVWKIADFTVAG